MRLDLKHLIRKKEIYSIIDGLVDAPIVVEDLAGNIVYGEPGRRSSKKYQILLGGETVGWVSGGRKASAAAGLLSYMALLEYEKKALGKETLEKYREITLLFEITEKLAANLNPKQVAGLIIHEAQRLIDGELVLLMMIDEETGLLEVLDNIGLAPGTTVSRKLGEGIAGSIAVNGRPEIINDIREDPRYVENGLGIVSLISAPLKIKDRTIGLIQIGHRKEANYTAADLKILSVLALQAAAAIENARLYDRLKETFLTSVYTLAETIEKRDPYTGGHTRRVMEYSIAIGQELGVAGEEMEKLWLAAVLHDIGKIGVRDNILLKAGRLSEEEFNEIKKHTDYGAEVLRYIKHFRDIIPGVRFHHERYDGRGYPAGLRGTEIDYVARIIAVADTFDAMTTDRPYRKALQREAAVQEIMTNAGSQFDPEVVQALLRVIFRHNNEDREG